LTIGDWLKSHKKLKFPATSEVKDMIEGVLLMLYRMELLHLYGLFTFYVMFVDIDV
jgi:hypothetical protein